MLTVEDTHHIIMLQHYFFKMHPEIKNRPALRKFTEYSHKRKTNEILTKAIPVLGPDFKHRDMLNSWIVTDTLNDWKNRTFEDKAAANMKQTKERLQQQEKFLQNSRKQQETFQQEIDSQIPIFEAEKYDIRNQQEFYTDQEQNEQMHWEILFNNVEEFLYKHRYEF